MSIGSGSQNEHWFGPQLDFGAFWLILVVFQMIIARSLVPVGPVDYWWYLAMGRITFETGRIPTNNMFLHTVSADAAFTDLPWLAETAMYAGWKYLSHAGLKCATNVMNGLIGAGFIWLALDRGSNRRVAGFCALVAGMVSFPVMKFRTRIFVLLPYLIFVGFLFRVLDRKLSSRWLWGAVPICLVWMNLHGSFLLLPALISIGTAAKVASIRWRLGSWEGPLIRNGIGASFACLLTPLVHPAGAKDVFVQHVLRIAYKSETVQAAIEWQPLWVDSLYEIFTLSVVVGGCVIVFMRRKSLKFYEIALFVAVLCLELLAVRMILWWAAIFVAVASPQLTDSIEGVLSTDADTSRTASYFHGLSVCAALAVVLMLQPVVPGHRHLLELSSADFKQRGEGAWVLSQNHPTEIVDNLKKDGYPGNLFNLQHVGGLLDFKLGAADPHAPRQVSFVDQRHSLSTFQIWRDYKTISKARRGWSDALANWNIGALLLGAEKQAPLIAAAKRSDKWHLRRRRGGFYLFFATSD